MQLQKFDTIEMKCRLDKKVSLKKQRSYSKVATVQKFQEFL